jgi:hypothetical protein
MDRLLGWVLPLCCHIAAAGQQAQGHAEQLIISKAAELRQVGLLLQHDGESCCQTDLSL